MEVGCVECYYGNTQFWGVLEGKVKDNGAIRKRETEI